MAYPVTSPVEPQSSAGLPSGGLSRYLWRAFVAQREVTPTIITVALFIFFAIDSSNFLTSLSLNSAAGFAGPVGAIAVGEVLVLVLGEIDLSAGQVFLTTPWVMYWLWQLGVPVGWAIVAALVVAIGIGMINGLITVMLNVPSFVAHPGDELHPVRSRAHLLERRRGNAGSRIAPAADLERGPPCGLLRSGDRRLGVVGDPLGDPHRGGHPLLAQADPFRRTGHRDRWQPAGRR